MRAVVTVAGVAVLALGVSLSGQGKHLNPVVDLLAARTPVFGTAMPAAGGGGGGNRGGGAAAAGAPATPAPAPAPAKTPLDLAKDALAHPDIDYFFTGSMERGVSTGRNGGPGPIAAFTDFSNAFVEAGAVTKGRIRPLAAKTPNISRADAPADPAVYIPNISAQLNAGVSIVNFVEVDNVDEITKGINAMRFASKGGTRPDAVGDAPAAIGRVVRVVGLHGVGVEGVIEVERQLRPARSKPKQLSNPHIELVRAVREVPLRLNQVERDVRGVP